MLSARARQPKSGAPRRRGVARMMAPVMLRCPGSRCGPHGAVQCPAWQMTCTASELDAAAVTCGLAGSAACARIAVLGSSSALRNRNPVRAENLVHGADQHGCSPGRPAVLTSRSRRRERRGARRPGSGSAANPGDHPAGGSLGGLVTSWAARAAVTAAVTLAASRGERSAGRWRLLLRLALRQSRRFSNASFQRRRTPGSGR